MNVPKFKKGEQYKAVKEYSDQHDWLTDLKKDLYELGRKDEREQILKDAVECVVCAGMEGDKWIMTYIGDYESMLKTCKAGDKVRIIIVKEKRE